MRPAAWLVVATAATAFAGAALMDATAAAPSRTSAVKLSASSNRGTPAQDLLARGKYLSDAADCEDCHTAKGGAPFAGGLPLKTQFGTVLSANITPDPTGIGGWTSQQFFHVLHDGVDDQGKHLYPAMPYNYYTQMSRADSDAIFAYLNSLRPVAHEINRNHLMFPMNIRGLMVFWNLLFLHQGEAAPVSGASAQWSRGRYLVDALGHCGACHTPMNLAGAPKRGRYLQGGVIENWLAPDLTPNPRTGLGGWSNADLTAFLKTGRNPRSNATAQMGEVVNYSTSRLSDSDLLAIAAYLQSVGPSKATPAKAPDRAVMRAGEAIFVDSCSACHRMSGQGVPGMFPPLPGDANLQQRDPTTTLRLILAGGQSTPTAAARTPLSMPSYGWKLRNDQIAAVATYIRNSWGNAAPAVSTAQVSNLRRKLTFPPAPSDVLDPTRLNSHPGPMTLMPPGTDTRDNGTSRAGRGAPDPDAIAQPATQSSAGGSPAPATPGPG